MRSRESVLSVRVRLTIRWWLQSEKMSASDKAKQKLDCNRMYCNDDETKSSVPGRSITARSNITGSGAAVRLDMGGDQGVVTQRVW